MCVTISHKNFEKSQGGWKESCLLEMWEGMQTNKLEDMLHLNLYSQGQVKMSQ